MKVSMTLSYTLASGAAHESPGPAVTITSCRLISASVSSSAPVAKTAVWPRAASRVVSRAPDSGRMHEAAPALIATRTPR
jgi:hypothetical protein